MRFYKKYLMRYSGGNLTATLPVDATAEQKEAIKAKHRAEIEKAGYDYNGSKEQEVDGKIVISSSGTKVTTTEASKDYVGKTAKVDLSRCNFRQLEKYNQDVKLREQALAEGLIIISTLGNKKVIKDAKNPNCAVEITKHVEEITFKNEIPKGGDKIPTPKPKPEPEPEPEKEVTQQNTQHFINIPIKFGKAKINRDKSGAPTINHKPMVSDVSFMVVIGTERDEQGNIPLEGIKSVKVDQINQARAQGDGGGSSVGYSNTSGESIDFGNMPPGELADSDVYRKLDIIKPFLLKLINEKSVKRSSSSNTTMDTTIKGFSDARLEMERRFGGRINRVKNYYEKYLQK